MISRIKTVHQAYHFLVTNLAKIYAEEEARSIANMVFEEVLSYNSMRRIMNENDLLPASLFEQLDHIQHQLMQHKPVQYITGNAHFFGLDFYVNESVLIPRPETEELVDWIIKSDAKEHFEKIIDIGTGSGCIPVTLKKNIPSADVYALDVSPKALSVAKKNAGKNNADIHFIEADVLNLSRLDQTFDVVVSNPPYVLESEAGEMNKNVLDYEPHLALFVHDQDALIFYNKIADLAFASLRQGGSLFFEINESKGEDLLKLLKNKGFTDAELRKDMRGRDRMIRTVKS